MTETTEADKLVASLTAALDEEEAAANAGARRVGMPWRAEPQPGTPGGLVLDDLGLVGSTGGRYAAEHIARQDPARTLRRVAAHREILSRYAETLLDLDRARRIAPGRPIGLCDVPEIEQEVAILRSIVEIIADIYEEAP